MEGEREKSPVNAEQQEENIDSVSSDGQGTCGQPSSSTSAVSSKPESPEKQMDGSERALNDNIGVQLCPDCNIELDPIVHRFCYGCGKTIQEIVSNAHKEEDNNGVQLCPNCNIELDTNVHKFCYRCGKNVQEMVSNVQKKQDTNLSHTPVPESDSSEQISNSVIDVASNIKEVKQQVVVGETERVVETQGSQQLTAVTEQTPVNETKTVEEAKSQAGNGNELNVSDAGHTVSGSAEQTSNHVIVVSNEIEQIKQIVVHETAVTETLTESVQKSPASPEKTITDDQNSIGKDNEGGETGSMDVDSTVPVPNKSLIPSSPDFPRHDEGVSGVSQSESSAQVSNTGSDIASIIMEVKQVVVGEAERAVAETVGQGYQQLTTVSEKTSVNENKTVEEATSQAGNGNELNISDAGHTVSGSAELTSNHVIVVANKVEEVKQVVVQETAATETLTESVQNSPASPEKTTVRDQNSIGKGNEGGETGSMDVDSTVQVPNKSLIPSNPDFPRHDEGVSGVSQSESSAQVSNTGSDVASIIMEVKQVVVGEAERAVAETVGQGYQQLTTVSEKTSVNENKTVEEATSQAGNGNELNVSDAGHTVSGSAELTSNHVIVVANKVEEVKQVVVQETAATETLTESVQNSPASPEKTTVRDQNSIGKGNEGGETGSMDVDSTVQVPNKSLIPSNPDFPRHDEGVSGVSQSESSAQVSNTGSDVASIIMEVKQVVVGEAERAVAETVGQGYQQLTTVSEKTSVNENKTVEEATSQAGNGNELNVSDAGHTVSDSAEQTSNRVIVVANKIQIKQVVVQEAAVPGTLTESVQQSPASPEGTTLGQRNSIEGKESDETNPEHVVTLGSVRSDQISEDTADVESTVQPQDKGILQSKENYSEFSSHGGNVGGTNSNKQSDTAEVDDELMNDPDLCIKENEKPFGSEILDLPEVSEVLDEFYEIFDGLKAKTPENNKKNATGNSEEELEANLNVNGNENIAQNTVIDQKGENSMHDISSDRRRTTRSTTVANDETHQLGVQNEVAEKNETLLRLAEKASNHPLSEGNGSAGLAIEGNNASGHFYRKPDLEEEEKRNKRKGKGNNNKNVTHNSDGRTLTVVFHAILSDKFKLNDNKIVIRGDTPIFDGWKEGGVPVRTEEYIDKQLLLHSKFVVPLQHASFKCAYKYILLDKNNTPTYERLVEFSSWSGIVNRCLVVGKEYAAENKTFHKYDGFVYPKPGAISWSRFFPSGSAMNDRRAFFRKFFPKWSGFYVDILDSKIQSVHEALQNLEYLVEGISAVWTSTSGYPYRSIVDKYKLKLWELFEEILMPKVLNNLKVLESQTKNGEDKVHALVSSLIITYVFTKYDDDFKSEQYEILLKCLRLPPEKEVCSEFMKRINKFDDNILSSFNKIILKLYKQLSSKKSLFVNWLSALPMLHFLRRESRPFEDVICEKPVDVTNWKWWGLEELPYRDIRRHITAREAIEMLPDLMNIFDMDRLLKRTFLLLCPVEIYGDLLKTECFSSLELCVTMRKLLPDTKTNFSYTRDFVEYLALFFKEINQTLSDMSPKEFPKERLQETLVLLNNLVCLVQNVKQYLQLNQIQILCRLVECLITAIVLQKEGSDLQDEPTILGNKTERNEKLSTTFQLTDIPEMSSLFKKQCGLVEKFVDTKLPVHLGFSTITPWNQELQAWNELLSLSAPEIFYKPWHDKYIDKFQSRIRKVSPLLQIELFCQSDEQKCNPDIATCLSKVAFEAVERVVQGGHDQQHAFDRLSRNSSTNGIKLLNAMLHKAWPSELKEGSQLNDKKKDEILLNHLLTWSTWPEFLKFFGSNSSAKKELAEDLHCAIMMSRVESCLYSLIKSVEDGTVTVATLKLLKEHSKQYFKLGEIHQKNQNSSRNDETQLYFSRRISELDAFLTLRNKLECFIGFTNIFTSVDEELRILSEKIEQDCNELPILDLCAEKSGSYDVVFFNLDEKFCMMVSRMTEVKRSRILYKLWQEYGEKFTDKEVTMEIIFDKIWLKICDELNSVYQQFLDGEMQLKKIDKYLNMFEMDYDALEKEFMLLSRYFNDTATHLDQIKKKLGVRIRKVKSYKKLFDARQAAQAILKLQKAMGLKGDFSEVEKIEEIISGNFRNQAINSVSDNLLKAGELLEEVNQERRSCLTTFTNCSELVTWLRESIKDEQELKVFVDLAMISAGEDDMEIDRISCMHTSCLGFGSLIFGYKPDHGFKELMRLCKPVWQAVDAHPNIRQKLVLTERDLSWLKQIKESHGSVALTTMVQVEAINSSGIYYIADRDKAKETKHVNSGVKLYLENLVCLVVPEDTDKNREEKIYGLEEIKDVQSKLMLIAGKAESGKEEVDQFNEVFEGILRVSNLYLQLCEVGEINYLTWKTKFQCSKNEGCREELLKNIDETCETMENELKEWKENINGKRHECYSLNHFTMKQILNLRKELAKACVGHAAIDELPLQTFMLLETVNKTIDPLLLANVLRTMIPENSIFLTEEGFKDEQKYFASDIEGAKILMENVKEEMDVIQPNMRRRKNSLETFTSAKETLEGMSMNYTEEYLLAALQHCGRSTTEDDLVAWVISCEYDEETVAMLCEEAKKNPRLSDLVKDVFGPECEAVNDEETFLCNTTPNEKKIERPKIVPKSDKPYVNNEEDTYLTLEILAAILEKLSESESDYIRRKLPSVLKEGEPNLLLVPKGEVFGCVLSLFMDATHQPLPTDEEVIVCDENTTAEEIELLWRRAVVDESGLLFCLANADLLDYDVSQQAVRYLELLTQGHARYHLVVICSIENEDKSNMVASLDQFRRQFPPLASMRGIQHYLKEQLIVSDAKMVGDVQWAPAATVDVEKLSVCVVQSSRAGMGKSLIVKHLAEQLTNLPNNKKLRKGLVSSLCPTIPVHGISVDGDRVTRTLLSHAVKRDIPVSRIFHLDMSQSVVKGLDNFLFKLVILRAVKDHSGNVWRRKPTDMYVVEITTDKSFETLTAEDAVSDGSYNQNTRKRLATNKYSFVKFLPRTHCLTPRETLDNIQQNKKGDTGFDMEKFHSEEYQRTFQYLTQFANGSNLDKFLFIYEPCVSIGDPVDALKIIIKYCGIRDPSWAELYHFVNFLNIQLRDCEESVFCNPLLVGDLLQGFRTFAVRFMIQMSRDFATRSLSDNNLGVEDASRPEEDDDLAPFQIRRRWELSPHPYIFFNHDRDSMTFLGFLLSENGDLLDPGSNRILEQRLMEPTLRGQLKLQGVDFDVNYEKRDRMARIENLCSVMGIEYLHDPDPTYELTTDNVEKILAIHMRFRCGIPVVIMGETGCGKTRLIRFMCELQAGPDGPKNLLLMKVHGGTSYAEIEKKVKDAEKLASCNEKINVDTILFFDEANTTDAIDLIKEIMVDRRVNGRAINPELTRLHFIAACNPYRKHTKEMIKKLESAGLGYHVSADETEDKLGSIPLRQLVYRVHPLPESMRPLVWDFGQLTDHIEELYTAQIVRRFMVSPTPGLASARPATGGFDGTLHNAAQASCIAKMLSASQKYMRNQKNECSFVSLRDVERAMKVIIWLYSNSELIDRVIGEEDDVRDEDNGSSEESSEEESCESDDDIEQVEQPLSQIVRAVILGIGVCYYARLNEREAYCKYICRYFDNSCPLPGGARRMQNAIIKCQRGFLKDIQLGQNIARNTALSENVFMMAICTELRIPLFVVGKPGSSKSLAKDVISTNMKAGNSQSELFKNLKQIHMQSYQCSPLSTPEGIVSTFRQCAKLQKDKDLKKFVSVVVLDEIGLAEDSPLMPLKTLHPLLEDGTATTEESGTPSDHHRVGFIGLSNWALDPAKMNRGIMLSRGVPSEDELCDSARGICSGNKDIQSRLETIIRRLCLGYFDLYKEQSNSETLKNAQKEEFFGLRDFYSLVKMVYGFAVQAEQGDQLGEIELEQSIRRNFSGLDDLDPVKIFSRQFRRLKHYVKYPSPECLPVNLIQESLGRTEVEGESRYLLVLTENYAALRLLQGQFHDHNRDHVVIFGSSFPKDQQYTQICRNINRIKVCMETGRMVILLNLESLYESLYDALNQYYVYLDKQKYVDLGLGNHRVKCRVADKFKLIVVAEKDVVYQRFPIPLINRLEKHLLVMSTGLTERQARLVKELEGWVKLFSEAKPENSSGESVFKPGDCFVGYHSDTAAAVVMKISNLGNDWSNEQILSQSIYTLLQCASPDAIARLPATELKHDAEELWTEYFRNQKHGSLKDYLVHCLGNNKDTENDGSLVQITTHSRLLSQANSRAIASAAGFTGSQSRCISLQEFHTEQQFTKTLEEFFVALGGAEGLLLVQCDNGETNFNLIACCRYLVDDTRRRTLEDFDVPVKPIHIIFIIQLPKIAGGCQHFVGFQGGKWQSVHIDELLESNEQLPQIEQLVNRSVSDLFLPAYPAREEDIEDMDVDLDASLPSGCQELRVENTEDSDEKEIDQQKIKPTLLLKNCLQAAAARIYDESAELDRATKRIEILLKWLPEDDSQETEFSEILATRVHKLLQQRDEKCPEDQRLWLQHEALRQGHLQETGTFRKALWQKLSSIVSPMLSEVIAYCDQNHNLDLLREEKEWKTRLWLTMIDKEVITPLSYDSFTSPVSGRVRERARVSSAGIGHRFSGKFPFSWIIKDMVNVLLLKVGADPSKTLVSLRGVFYSSPLGKLLKPTFEDRNIKDEAAMNYLNDFLHMMYKPIVEGELQLICDAVLAAAGKLHQSLYENEEFELDIPFIHFTYSLIQARLVNFSELVHAFPDLVQTILTKRDQLDVGEMVISLTHHSKTILDVVALECCFQQLEPRPRDLENADNRLIWCNRVQCIRPIIQVMKSLISRPSQQQLGNGDSEARFHAQLFGERSAHYLQNCRTTWIRLDVVRMFIEHTCPPGQSTHPADAKNAFLLSRALRENTDFSTVHSMTVIERFLKSCSDGMRERLIRFDISQCEICKSPLQDPVQMPCEHICCMSCANGWFQERNVCPICRKEVGGDFKVKISQKCRHALEVYNGFRNRCKSFFMELVSVYCFGEQLPNPDLVRKFISYVIKDENRTEDFTPFDGQGIDVTPVIRSYILQQLLVIKGREKEVYKHLEEYLHRARGLAEQREHLIEVCVLCVQCMEDVETVKLLKAKEGGENVQILLASKELERTLRTLHDHQNSLNIDCLRDIAGIRAALDVLSTYLGDDFAENVKRFGALPKCLETAKYLCSNSSRSVLQLFLLKQLVRHDPNGIDAVKERCKRKELKWIMPPQSEEQDKTPDTFIVHHENYRTVREALGKAILTSNIDDLNVVIQDLQAQPSARSCYVLLALFREITTNFSLANEEDRIPDRIFGKLSQYIEGMQFLPNELKGLAGNFLTNFENANGQLLQLSPRQSGNDRRLIEVLVHFLIVVKCLPRNRLLQPLTNLALNPALMMNAFIPTMPHDDGPEVLGAIPDGRPHECPNGHRYVITNCGRPNQNYNCPTCHLAIGGVNHVLVANNREASRQDRSSTGHILGPAQAQQQNVTSERNLNPLSCGVLRCLTHAAMLLGTDQNIQSIAAVIKPPVQDVIQFLKEHIQHDIRCIARSTGNNDDEAVQIIHLVLVGIVNNLGQLRGNLNIDGNLTTKNSRTAWEDAFMTTYLNPVLSAISHLLQDSFGRMVRDERLGNNRLMRLLHELDGPNYESITELNPMCPALWRYRKKITIEYLSFKFQEYSQGRDKPDRCEVLAEFLKKEHHLRALQYLPDIIKLQRLLFEKFRRRLDRNEAEEFTLGKFFKTAPQIKEQFSALVNSFKMAWKIVRSSLTQDGPHSISQGMCRIEVTNSTPISMFLPASSGQGRCALALNNFLVTLHNDFIGRCKSLLKDENCPPEIPLANMTKAHLVAYDPDKDFLPMILAHCDYSLKVGEGTTVEFNWKCLERQLVDRFIRGRPRLTSLVELFVFSKDICDGGVFKALKQKIRQEELTRPVQDQILNELNQLTDVCDVLKSLHIAIGFLSSAGGDPSMSIHEYLHSGLKMTLRNGLKSGKAEQFCQLQHVVSLWLLLSLERARVLTKRKQDPFDDVSDKVKSSLDKKQKFRLNSGLQKLNVDHFVRVLLEFILLYLKHVPEDQLHFPLSQYINAKLEEKECEVIEGLEEYIPEDIKVEHAVEAWKVACQKSEDYHSRMQE